MGIVTARPLEEALTPLDRVLGQHFDVLVAHADGWWASSRIRALGALVALALGILLAPLVAEAQQVGKVYRIGFLSIRPNSAP